METFLLKKQIDSLKAKFIREGGFRENLFRARRKALQEACTACPPAGGNSTESRLVSLGGRKRLAYRKKNSS